MDYKKNKASQECITRNIQNFDDQTGNIYRSVSILAKRANQISADMKAELQTKIAEYASVSHSDNLDEVFENREQIEVAKYYETLPKPTLIATQEFLDGEVFFKDSAADEE